MTSHTTKIESKWWFLLPIFLGVIGGLIVWFALKSYDRKQAKICLILGFVLDISKILILVGGLMTSENLNLVADIGSSSENNDFDIQFNINSP
ncbi:MAG: hypothetical protein ACE5DL_01155 [Nitrosopumilaceae archaeon]